MRPVATLVLLLSLAVTSVATAQVPVEVTNDEQILLKQVQTDKRAIYAKALELSDAESRVFWPVYDEYEGKVKALDDRFLNLVNDYAAHYESLDDTRAAAMLKEKMAIEKDRMALKQKYTAKVAKVLPPKKALRYAQVETRVDNMLRTNVYSLIPLAQ
jgi:hypothetical protein